MGDGSKHSVSPCSAIPCECQMKQMLRKSEQLPHWKTGDHQDALILKCHSSTSVRHMAQNPGQHQWLTVTEQWTNNQWLFPMCKDIHLYKYSVSQKIPPPWGYDIFHFFHKQLRICNRFFTNLLHVPIFARLQIFIQLCTTLTKLCHIKCDYLVHVICPKCPPSAEMHAFRRLRKSLIALLIVVCGKSL